MVIGADMAELIAFVEIYLEVGDVGLLSSGDPGFYGLLAWVKREFPEVLLHVEPGISSIQLACARFAAPWQDAVLLSLHGRASQGWENKVLTAPVAILLTGGTSGPQMIAARLLEVGSVDCMAAYGLALSLENENLEKKSLSQWAADTEVVAGGVFLIFN
jgi:precorrin-6y C5,15-methyltransferase (decarboxylating) CbiE subunit